MNSTRFILQCRRERLDAAQRKMRTPRDVGGMRSVSAFMRWTKRASQVSLVPESGWSLLLLYVYERFNCHEGPKRSLTQPNLVLNP